MRICLRDPVGRERELGKVSDPRDAPTEAMRCCRGDDDATGPHREPEPQTLATISAGNLASLAGRLEVRARAIAGEHPESAADLLMAARFTRHAVRWVG